jgi:hypothetical protein
LGQGVDRGGPLTNRQEVERPPGGFHPLLVFMEYARVWMVFNKPVVFPRGHLAKDKRKACPVWSRGEYGKGSPPPGP